MANNNTIDNWINTNGSLALRTKFRLGYDWSDLFKEELFEVIRKHFFTSTAYKLLRYQSTNDHYLTFPQDSFYKQEPREIELIDLYIIESLKTKILSLESSNLSIFNLEILRPFTTNKNTQYAYGFCFYVHLKSESGLKTHCVILVDQQKARDKALEGLLEAKIESNDFDMFLK